MLAALLFGALRAGSGLMQIEAGIPVEIIDVIQATILLFLAATSSSGAGCGSRRTSAEPTELQTVTQSYGSTILMEILYGIPIIGVLFQFIGYVIEITPGIAPIVVGPGRADRAGRPVRGHERAVRHREHRHRGHDAVRARSSASSSPGSCSRRWARSRVGGPSRITPALLAGVVAAIVAAMLLSRPARMAVDHDRAPTRSSAA